MISICCSDIGIVLFLLIFNQPGINRGRYIDMVNWSALSCKWFTVLANFLFAAPWFNFLGKDSLLRSLVLCTLPCSQA